MKDDQVLEKTPPDTGAMAAEDNGHAPVGSDGASAAGTDTDYTRDNFQVLRDAAHIRLRPGMYIGDTASSGLHHLVYQLVYNSVDDALAGHCHLIQGKINL